MTPYTAAPDLAVLTCYFNPQRYKSRRRNFEVFSSFFGAASHSLFVVECAFGEDNFELPPRPNLLQIRGGDILWQKERLLTLLLEQLPKNFQKIAWVDCDVIFQNLRWMLWSSAALKDVAVIQPFSKVLLLHQGETAPSGNETKMESFASAISRDKEAHQRNFDKHGHTGFAWAARREIFSNGFYDANVLGSADHLMAHAFCGSWDSPCVHRLLGPPHFQHFQQWAQETFTKAQGRVGFTEGALYHLWHGELQNRRYIERNRFLIEHQFDPAKDLQKTSNGLWEWSPNKPALREWSKRYFEERKEDGA